MPMSHDLAWCYAQMIQMYAKAKVGHLGSALSCLDGLHTVFRHMQPSDRFVLSKGHAAGALYTVLAAHGFIPTEWLDTFHQDGTKLPGHPPANLIGEIPFATGSLGHGLSLAAGFALSQKLRKNTQRTYCITSDGEWQEGSTWEALIFLSHHQLTNLTVLVDCNGWQGFGQTNHVASMHDLYNKIAAFDVTISVVDGHDVAAIEDALNAESNQPKFIIMQTIKGHGIPHLADSLASHYLPITNDQLGPTLDYFHRRSV
jgi:transketolase